MFVVAVVVAAAMLDLADRLELPLPEVVRWHGCAAGTAAVVDIVATDTAAIATAEVAG